MKVKKKADESKECINTETRKELNMCQTKMDLKLLPNPSKVTFPMCFGNLTILIF